MCNSNLEAESINPVNAVDNGAVGYVEPEMKIDSMPIESIESDLIVDSVASEYEGTGSEVDAMSGENAVAGTKLDAVSGEKVGSDMDFDSGSVKTKQIEKRVDTVADGNAATRSKLDTVAGGKMESDIVICSGEILLLETELQIVAERPINPLLCRIPPVRETLKDATKKQIARNGFTKKIPLNSKGEVSGNILYYLAAKDMNILKESDFELLNIPDAKEAQHILLDMFLQPHYDKTRLSLIAAEYYHELCEINAQLRANSARIGKNTRKEVSALIDIGDGNLGQALRLRRNDPEMFSVLIGTAYTFKDLLQLKAVRRYNSGNFLRVRNGEITLTQAWYALDKKQKLEAESESNIKTQTNALSNLMEDITANAEYQKNKNKPPQPNGVEIPKSASDTNNLVPQLNGLQDFYDDDNDDNWDSRALKWNDLLDDEHSMRSIKRNLSIIDKNLNDSNDLSPSGDFDGVNYVANTDGSCSQGVDMKVNVMTENNSTENNVDIPLVYYRPGMVSEFDCFNPDSYQFQRNLFFDVLTYPETEISAEQRQKQDENLTWLINNGKVHQHKSVRRNIGQINLLFENKDSSVVKPKGQLDLLDDSVRLCNASFGLVKLITSRLPELTVIEKAQLDVIEIKIQEFERKIRNSIFYA